MPKPYTPMDWYWLAEDGRVFSSARSTLVSSDDAGFSAWKQDGTEPSRWPADDQGNQTTSGLQAVLTPYGLFADLSAYAAARRYAVEIAGITAKIGGADAPVSTAREDRDGLRDTLTAITLNWRKDGANFKFADGVPRAATNDEMKASCGAAFAYVQAVFDCEAAIQSDLASSKPSLTTRAQVDTRFAKALKALNA